MAQKAKPITRMVSPEKDCADMVEVKTSQLKSLGCPSKSVSQPLNSKNSTSPHTSTTSSEYEPPLFTVAPYFEVRKSPKGGYGAFASEDIPRDTEILSEKALVQASSSDVRRHFSKLSADNQEAYLKLASFDDLDSDRIIAIFKTNRWVLNSEETSKLF
jgi:hypothetical protein